jgi:hypothetical protein
LAQQKVAQKVNILGQLRFGMSFQKQPNWPKITQSGHPAAAAACRLAILQTFFENFFKFSTE